ncbi:MAG: energy transducer TonB, partial [bacterium]
YQQIEAHKSYPLEEKQRGHEGKVKVGLVILADGALGKVWLVEPCSYEKLNEAAQLAVKQAAPFPKVPKSFNQDQLSIILKVAFKLL